MQSLTIGLHAGIADQIQIKMGTHLLGLAIQPDAVELQLKDTGGLLTQLASQVVLAIPAALDCTGRSIDPGLARALAPADAANPDLDGWTGKVCCGLPHGVLARSGLVWRRHEPTRTLGRNP